MTDEHDDAVRDFTFFLGEVVNVGTNQGTVRGQFTYLDRADEYLVSFPIDDDGLPFERQFKEHQLEKTRKH